MQQDKFYVDRYLARRSVVRLLSQDFHYNCTVLDMNKDHSLKQSLSVLRHIVSVEDRELRLFSLARQCGSPQDILSCRDVKNGVDIFLIEFDSSEDACRARALMGLSPVAGSNIASLIVPSSCLI